jgi:glycosyltransferase involved in cell wall biosynthesis
MTATAPASQDSAGRKSGPRVLACCGAMFTLGGLERMIVEALRTVVSNGGQVHCIVSSWLPDEMQKAAASIGASSSSGFYVYKLEKRPRNPLRYGLFLYDVVRTSAGLLRDAARFTPDCVLVPDLVTAIRNYPALFLLRLRGVRIVLALQNAPASDGIWRHLWRRTRSIVDVYVCASNDCASRLAALGVSEDKIQIVFNTAGHHHAMTAPARIPGRIVFAGQIIPAKGLDLLFDAAIRLVRQGMDLSIDVVGKIDGWVAPEYAGYREQLMEQAEASPLAGRVAFLGWRDDVPHVLAAATLHCCPSRPDMLEGLPLVVVEAKRAGTPTVAFAHGPFRELIDHGTTGWLAPSVTAAALADALTAGLVSTSHQASAIAASAAPYSIDNFRRGWLAALGEPLAAERGRVRATSPRSLAG